LFYKGAIYVWMHVTPLIAFALSLSKLCLPCIFFWAPLHVLCGLSHHQAVVLRSMGYPV
jgi:hypothetical protein